MLPCLSHMACILHDRGVDLPWNRCPLRTPRLRGDDFLWCDEQLLHTPQVSPSIGVGIHRARPVWAYAGAFVRPYFLGGPDMWYSWVLGTPLEASASQLRDARLGCATGPFAIV